MIRYDEKLNRKIKNLVNRYNAKINRLEKKEYLYGAISIPERISTKYFKENYNFRNELVRALKIHENFLKRGSEKLTNFEGAVLSEYEKRLLINERRLAKRRINAQIKFYEITKPKIMGTEAIVSFAQIGEKAYYNAIRKRQFYNKKIKGLTSKEIKDFITRLRRNSKKMSADIFKNNFIEILIDVLYVNGFSHADVHKVVSVLQKMNSQEFYNFYKNEKALELIITIYKLINTYGTDKVADEEVAVGNQKEFIEEFIQNIEEISKEYKKGVVSDQQEAEDYTKSNKKIL